ncbi:MAG: AAA family ATPase [Ignavibacteriae bacterium]|nr:AAA family ATPase [Ignavibacteriota bacterium]
MKIRKVEISNWRSIKHVDIEFQDLMIFIGQNNHGKSNILTALLLFFGQIQANDMDFHRVENELFVEITFGELNESEKSTFTKYVTSQNTIRVRKTISKEGRNEYNGYIEQPNVEWLKEENITKFTKREIASTLPLYNLLPKAGKITQEDFKQGQLEYIKINNSKLKFKYSIESTPFLGFKNVAKGIFGEVFFIPSVKNAKEELSTRENSVFGQLYSRVITRMSIENKEYIDAKNKITQLAGVLNKLTEDGKPNKQRPEELSKLEELLDLELKRWDTKIDVEITPPNIDDIFKVGAEIWIDDGIRTDIERKGHGLQRYLIFALIKTWAKIIREDEKEKTITNKETSIKKSKRKASKTNYFIFEEPELYLHPQSQRESFSALVELSKEENQVVLCTHSSSFIDLNFHRSICIVKKESIEVGSKILQCSEDIFLKNEDKKQFDMIRWINPERGELFFAKKVILLEGSTEKSVIPLIAKILNEFKYDVTLIDCGGKDSIPAYIKLLNKFSLPYTVVYDIDNQPEKTKESKRNANEKNKLIENAIDNTFGNSVKFKNDIEDELGIKDKPKSDKPYKAIKYILSDSFKISKSLKKKIETIYN